MSGNKTVLITGCSRGIGLSFVKHYLKNGWHVIATCRNPDTSDELKNLNPHELLPLDVTKDDSIEALAHALKDRPIDLLINNAGILYRGNDIVSLEKDTLVEQLLTNSVAPMILTSKILPNLLLSAKNGNKTIVANITSRMGSIDDNTSGGFYGYRASKAALNAMTKSLAYDLKSSHIIALLLHPGYVNTDMTGGHGNLEPDESVEKMSKIIEGCDLMNSGSFYHFEGSILPW